MKFIRSLPPLAENLKTLAAALRIIKDSGDGVTRLEDGSGTAELYVEDGELKVKFANDVVKTIATNVE